MRSAVAGSRSTAAFSYWVLHPQKGQANGEQWTCRPPAVFGHHTHAGAECNVATSKITHAHAPKSINQDTQRTTRSDTPQS
jgi:hypothetical protein